MKSLRKVLTVLLCVIMALSAVAVMTGCGSKEEKAKQEAAEKAAAEAEAAQAEAEKAAAEEAASVDQLIKDLGKTDKLKLDDDKKVKAAREAYDALSDEAKEKVTVLGDLESAEARIKKLQDEKKKADKEAEEKKKAEEEAKAQAEAEAEAEAKAQAEAEAKAKKEAKKKAEEEAAQEEETSSKDVAKGYIGKNIDKLIGEIGSPSSRTINDGCYDGGRDLIAEYDGFTVYAHAKKDSDKFVITDVE